MSKLRGKTTFKARIDSSANSTQFWLIFRIRVVKTFLYKTWRMKMYSSFHETQFLKLDLQKEVTLFFSLGLGSMKVA